MCVAVAFRNYRRQDDWLDVGHGQWAADYYQEYCQTHLLVYEERAYRIMVYHYLDDALGETVLRGQKDGVLFYHIFKDADALDRFRLGSNGLDGCPL